MLGLVRCWVLGTAVSSVCLLLQVVAAFLWVVVMVVGVVVWELHSGREHLIFVSAKYSIILCSGGLHVCVSVLGRMVDALAVGADEGRGNLR